MFIINKQRGLECFKKFYVLDSLSNTFIQVMYCIYLLWYAMTKDNLKIKELILAYVSRGRASGCGNRRRKLKANILLAHRKQSEQQPEVWWSHPPSKSTQWHLSSSDVPPRKGSINKGPNVQMNELLRDFSHFNYQRRTYC